MWGKSGCSKGRGLCPLSFGLALGITAFIAMLIWSAWMMIHGVPAVGPAAAAHVVFPLTWGTTFAYAFLCFIKGFIFGFILILIYDCFICCCKGPCCKRDSQGGGCGCGCANCSCGVKSSDTTMSGKL